MAKLRIFAVGANLKLDQPIHFLAPKHRHYLELRVSRKELVQLDNNTFQEVQNIDGLIAEVKTAVGYDDSVVNGHRYNTFREAWALKPSGRIYVWQMKTRRA